MDQQKKVLIFLVFSAIIAAAIFIFISREREKLTKQPLPKLNIPKYLEEQPGVELAFEKKDFDFPSKISVLQATSAPLSSEEIKNVATNLGFTFEPKVSEDVFHGRTYTYAGEESSLVAKPQVSQMDYTLYTIPGYIDKKLDDADIVSIATDFLIDNELVSSEDIEFVSFVFYKETPGQGLFPVTKEEAAIYQVNFSLKVTNIPVLTLNPLNTLVYVRLLPDGSVFSAHVEKLEGVKESESKYKLKTYEELSASINEATVVTIDDGNINPTDVSKDAIQEIVVNNVKLAYLIISPGSTTLQPVYLLEGKSRIKELASQVNIRLYLSAISKNP